MFGKWTIKWTSIYWAPENFGANTALYLVVDFTNRFYNDLGSLNKDAFELWFEQP